MLLLARLSIVLNKEPAMEGRYRDPYNEATKNMGMDESAMEVLKLQKNYIKSITKRKGSKMSCKNTWNADVAQKNQREIKADEKRPRMQ